MGSPETGAGSLLKNPSDIIDLPRARAPARPLKPFGPQSTVIAGAKKPTPCERARALLAADVYNDSGAPKGWHRVGEAIQNTDNGFYAQLYAADGFEAELKSGRPPRLCPPVLAFRGTNMEDTRVSIADWKINPENPQDWLMINASALTPAYSPNSDRSGCVRLKVL